MSRATVSVGLRDVVVFEVTDTRNPSAARMWAGRDENIGVGAPVDSPVGLRGWKSIEAARRDLDFSLVLMAAAGVSYLRYVPRVFTPKARG